MLRYTICSLFTIFITFLAFGQSAFFDFEKWQENYFYDEPKDFITLNYSSFIGALTPNVTKVPGIKGSGIRLETRRSLFSQELHLGVLTNFNTSVFPFGGIPYTNIPDTLSGYIRFTIQPRDTAVLAVIFKRVGIPVSSNIFPITGAIDSFLYFEVPLIQNSVSPDSVLFILTSGSLTSPVEGSIVELDELKFKNTSHQLPNSSFEEFEPIIFEEPEQWATQNFVPAILRYNPPVSKSTEHVFGQYGLRIENILVQSAEFNINQVFGACYIGDAGLGTQQPYPFSSSDYVQVSTHYTYIPSGKDTAWLVVRPYQFNITSQSREFYPISAIPLYPSNVFKAVSQKISIPNGKKIDSLFIEFYAGNYFNGIDPLMGGTAKPGSVLIVDGLMLSGPVTTIPSKAIINFEVYPNPVKDVIFWNLHSTDNTKVDIRIISSTGNLMESVHKINHVNAINISELPAGMYSVQCITKEKVYSADFIKQ